jgi:hypothetical protein
VPQEAASESASEESPASVETPEADVAEAAVEEPAAVADGEEPVEPAPAKEQD